MYTPYTHKKTHILTIEPPENSMSKRTKKPSHKLTDIDNGGELELKSHQIARDRAIAADKAKISHDSATSAAGGKATPTTLPPTSSTPSNVPPHTVPAVVPVSNVTEAAAATTTGSTISSRSKRAAVHDCTDVEDVDDDVPSKSAPTRL